MFCSNCGSQISPETVVCPNCGVSVKKDNTSKILIAIISVVAITIVGVLIFSFWPSNSSVSQPVVPTAVVIPTTEATTIATTAATTQPATNKTETIVYEKVIVIDPYNITGSPSYGSYVYTGRTNTPGDILYLRSGPSTQYSVLAKMKHNSVVEVYGMDSSGTWYYVRYGNTYGWAYSRYIY